MSALLTYFSIFFLPSFIYTSTALAEALSTQRQEIQQAEEEARVLLAKIEAHRALKAEIAAAKADLEALQV